MRKTEEWKNERKGTRKKVIRVSTMPGHRRQQQSHHFTLSNLSFLILTSLQTSLHVPFHRVHDDFLNLWTMLLVPPFVQSSVCPILRLYNLDQHNGHVIILSSENFIIILQSESCFLISQSKNEKVSFQLTIDSSLLSSLMKLKDGGKREKDGGEKERRMEEEKERS